jgi:outer membrane lipoprotein carrier protein
MTHARTCLARVEGARADFTHELLHPLGGNPETLTGVLWVGRGRRFRLEYREPEPRLLVADQTWIRSFDQASGKVIKTPVRDSPLAQAFALVFGDPLPEGFSVTFLGGARRPGEPGLAALELRSGSPQSLFEKVVIVLGAQCPCLRRILLVDRAGSAVRLTLENIQLNPPLPRGLFTFKSPPGTKVVSP